MSTESPSVLARLQTPDEMALIFNPVGLGGRMEPEDAARFQMEAIAAATLVDTVPIEIRENFERARKLHIYGVLEYEFFTAAPEYALLVLEAALRVRFVSYYDNRIPVFRGEEPGTLTAEDFDAVRAARRTRLRRVDGSKSDLPRNGRYRSANAGARACKMSGETAPKSRIGRRFAASGPTRPTHRAHFHGKEGVTSSSLVPGFAVPSGFRVCLCAAVHLEGAIGVPDPRGHVAGVVAEQVRRLA
jgi:hypothetical protein